ncbi:leucine-rich repeat domain-containing protein [Lysinibacillus sp. NPDC047702]|uniref:leucine-rich repeat domain-containing protein n=1 Tax=unclassified Lysinibacillus TaxID=2636778 RepID=UPI003D0214A5
MDITQDFIDENFKTYVLETFCNNRKTILFSDVNQIESLQLRNRNYTSLQGIEHFIALKELDCAFNDLTELDTRYNYHLQTLICCTNKITSLDISNQSKLEELSCRNNELTQLDVSYNPLLKILNCTVNQITSLNLMNNSFLEKVDCGFNRMRELDVSHNVKLVSLVCYQNMLSALHLEQNHHLQELNCGYNSLLTLHLEHHAELTHLDCGNNYLLLLDITSCLKLESVRCNHNHLNYLDVSQNPMLQRLRCFNNHITELDIRHNVQLVELYCSENKLTQLDTTYNLLLEELNYADNLMMEPMYVIQGVGTFQYDNGATFYRSTWSYKEQEIFVQTTARTEAMIKRLSPTIKKVWNHLDTLNSSALDLITEIHAEEDKSNLLLVELIFNTDDTTIQLGYDVGDSPAGQLYIYVSFDEKFNIDSKLVYETY